MNIISGVQRQTPLISALKRQKQADLYEFETNPVYIGNSGQSGLHSEILFQSQLINFKRSAKEVVYCFPSTFIYPPIYL